MSATPRTDAEAVADENISKGNYLPNGWVPADFARQLERELAQLETSHLNLKGFLADVESVKRGVENERDQWRALAEELAGYFNKTEQSFPADAIARFATLSKPK